MFGKSPVFLKVAMALANTALLRTLIFFCAARRLTAISAARRPTTLVCWAAVALARCRGAEATGENEAGQAGGPDQHDRLPPDAEAGPLATSVSWTTLVMPCGRHVLHVSSSPRAPASRPRVRGSCWARGVSRRN